MWASCVPAYENLLFPECVQEVLLYSLHSCAFPEKKLNMLISWDEEWPAPSLPEDGAQGSRDQLWPLAPPHPQSCLCPPAASQEAEGTDFLGFLLTGKP